MVPKPSFRGQFGTSHLKSFLWRASCFLWKSVFCHHNSQIATRKIYLLSEGHFPTHLHDGWSHRIEVSTNCDGEPVNSDVYDDPETDPYLEWPKKGPDSVDVFSVLSTCGLEESTLYEEATTDCVAQLVPPYPESAE